MDNALTSLSNNARPILLICIGGLLGIALAYPLGWHLPDVYANLLGGVIGALATIAGAFLVLNHQIRDANERYQRELNDRNEREKVKRARIETEAENRMKELQAAVVPALYIDLRTAKVICTAQRESATKVLKWPKDAQFSWCERIEHIPMVAFDRLGAIILQLGDLSQTLVAIYSDGVRLSALIRGELSAPDRYISGERVVQAIADKLPEYINQLESAMKALERHLPQKNPGDCLEATTELGHEEFSEKGQK